MSRARAQVYSRVEIQQLLEMIEHGNKASGGMKKTCVAFGVLGPLHVCVVLHVVSCRVVCVVYGAR